ncbi:N-acetylglucosamine-6-phosphate deacetylase [Peribacillus sp. NPDC097295]|uniref:N-acetylglucosamine-6-phosphate deacetylase n=1 Tax=Peribacillus sp. NPDC097295 TaxID=3364402 RepID=UPI0037FCF31B
MILKNITIYSEEKIIERGYLLTNDEKIVAFGPMEDLNDIHEEGKVIDFSSLPGYKVIPGMIDIHIHGVDGADTMDATQDALHTMAKALPREGTTSFLATTMTQAPQAIENALINAGQYIHDHQPPGLAEILGVHLEGPFVNPKMAGAQPEQYMMNPDPHIFEKWNVLSKNTVKVVTLAPEQPGGSELIKYLKEHGIVASIGHSDATYDEVDLAIADGASQVTHLFNQMRGLHHREPGVVGAALLRDELKAELIIDGIHVRPEIVKLAYKQKTQTGLILITDSMRAKCLKNGTYDLGGQEVTVKDGKAVLSDGTLAGSILKMGQAFKNLLDYASCSLEEAVEMASLNPAKQLHLDDKKGSIKVGKDADLVILNEGNEVVMTICRGQIAFSRMEVEYGNH